MQFDFATAGRILFARGSAKALPGIAREFGTRAMVVCGGNPERYRGILQGLQSHGVDTETFTVAGEPTVHEVRNGARAAREQKREVIIGIGGGSAMDAAKAIAMLATNSGEPLDYVEVVGRGETFERPGLPFLAVPTTAGSGAEVTRNAVLSSPEDGLKASLRSAGMLAKAAVLDPELTRSLPPPITAYTGLDALTQVIEPYVSSRANAFVDLWCVEGMRLIRDSIERVFRDGSDIEARTRMSFGSLLGGLSLANSGLGVVHGFASPLGGLLDAHHGEICAAILAHGVAANVRAIPADARGKFDEAARILTGAPHATALDLVSWLNGIVEKLEIRSLAELGLRREQIPHVIAKAAQASSMKANPINLSTEQLTAVANAAFAGGPATI